MSVVNSLWWGCGLLLLLVSLTLQAEILFTSEVPAMIYTVTNHATLINCTTVSRSEDGEDTPISCELYKDSQLLNIYDMPQRHSARADGFSNVRGILITPTLAVDSGCRYECGLPGGATERLSTVLYVGDGTPRPVEPNLIFQRLYSFTLLWDPALIPANTFVSHYTLTLVDPAGEVSMVELSDNGTEVELGGLSPATTYTVTVVGTNSYGNGRPSLPFQAATASPLVPPSPTEVSAIGTVGNTSSSITVSWTQPTIDREEMTPIDHYTVFYAINTSRGPPTQLNTADNTSTVFVISDLTVGGNYRVGVAVVNSAGASEVEYFCCIELPSTTTGALSMVAIIGIAVGGAVIVTVIIILIMLIVCLKKRTKALHLFAVNGHTESPQVKKRGNASSKKDSPDLSLSSTAELPTLEYMPRRAGSPRLEEEGETTITVADRSYVPTSHTFNK